MPVVASDFTGSYGIARKASSHISNTESRPTTYIVCESQFQRHGHEARFPEVDLAQQVVSVRGKPQWRSPSRAATQVLDGAGR